ncbi:hypothetical protein OHS70_13905 [Streptomyces sp. NBC_00390]|uniref:hypothetical protein n=1 Tax=unclassified Streptomyces TaxID=2593676 RepID=UPI002E22D4A2
MRLTTRTAALVATLGLAIGGALAGAAPASAAIGDPTGCSAYVDNGGKAIGWCSSGTGQWQVFAKCAGTRGVTGPHGGDIGYRKGQGTPRATEKASVLNCGSSGYAVSPTIKIVR